MNKLKTNLSFDDLFSLVSKKELKKEKFTIDTRQNPKKESNSDFYDYFDTIVDKSDQNSFEKYYQFSQNKFVKSFLYRKLIGITDNQVLINFLFVYITYVKTNMLIFLMIAMLMMFVFLAKTILSKNFFSSVYVNWISYMRYILKKENFTEEEIKDATKIMIYENDGEHATHVVSLFNESYLKKQDKVIKYLKEKQQKSVIF